MDKKGLVLITYRDRPVHRDILIPYLNRYFPHLRIGLVEQSDNNVWNKGLLYNAGFKELSIGYDYVILHDVDFIPNRNVDYRYTPVPTLISTECSQFGYGQCYPTFFGGVIGMSTEHYKQVNGFSNRFRGWGGEDDNLYRRCIHIGLPPVQRKGNRFENFTHPRLDVRPHVGADWNNPDYQHNWKLVHEPVDITEGLSTAEYKIISHIEHPECIHLRITTI